MRSHHLPRESESIRAIWLRHFLQFRKSWMVSFFWILLEPLFVLVAIGYGLGSYIHQIQGTSYLEFFFPALICNTIMLVAFFECTYGSFTKLSHTRIYHTMLLAPVSPRSIWIAEVLWAGSKSMFSVVGVILIASIFGAVSSWRILLTLPVLFLTSCLFALVGLLVSSKVKNYDQIIYPTSGLIVPLSLFSGTYFPLDAVPRVLQWFSYISPLTHAVSATREIIEGRLDSELLVHVGLLVLMFLVLAKWVGKQFSLRLID